MPELPPDADDGFFLDGPDGPVPVGYRRAAAPDADPFVRGRMVGLAGGDVVTEWAPAPARPPSYPPGLPFLPGRPAWTTEVAPGADGSPGVRWPCADAAEAAAVLAAARAASEAAGWAAGSEVAVPPALREAGADGVALARAGAVRLLLTTPMAPVVQLLDLHDRPGAPPGPPAQAA